MAVWASWKSCRYRSPV